MIRARVTTLVLAIAVAAAVFGQNPQNIGRGFAADKTYQFNDLDHINTFNGNLNVVLPIGPEYHVGSHLSYRLMLGYSGNLWVPVEEARSFTDSDGYHDINTTVGEPIGVNDGTKRTNAGIGWLFGMGQIVLVGDPNSTPHFDAIYITPDGAEHTFGFAFQNGLGGNHVAVAYPGDSMHCRAFFNSDNTFELDFPDGGVHKFDANGTLTSMADAFGNVVTIQRNAGSSLDYTVNDGYRQHTIKFKYLNNDGSTTANPDELVFTVISEVDLAGPNGTVSKYVFHYGDGPTDSLTTISRVIEHIPNCTWGTGISVPMLTGITLPDGTQFHMDYDRGDGGQSYTMLRSDDPAPFGCWVDTPGTTDSHSVVTYTAKGNYSGHLTKLTLPTMGSIAWTYNTWGYPTDADPQPVPTGVAKIGPAHGSSAVAVAERRELDRNDGVLSRRTYAQYKYYDSGLEQPHTQITKISAFDGFSSSNPAGTLHSWSENYYSIGRNTTPLPAIYEEYGLPFTRFSDRDATTIGMFPQNTPAPNPNTSSAANAPNPGPDRFLSTKTFDASGNLLKITYVQYEADGGLHSDVNRRVKSDSTQYVGGNTTETVTTTREQYDTFGHYCKETVTSGAFDSTENRIITTDYNREATANPTDPPSPTLTPAPTDPWIVNTFSSKYVTDTSGSVRSLFSFNRQDGFLERQRTMLGTTPQPKDIVAVFTRSARSTGTAAAGDVATEEYYGGDTQDVATDALKTMQLPPNPTYRLTHTYKYGSLATTAYQATAFDSPKTAAIPFLTADADIDASTGLPVATRDTLHNTTLLSYDSMFRLTQSKPDTAVNRGAWLQYSYSGATSTAPASVVVQAKSSTGAVMHDSEYKFDDLGRVTREIQQLPEGQAERDTVYNGMGWKAAVSEQETTPSHWTTFSGYDPFGRYTVVHPPDDDASHTRDVHVTYTGMSTTARTVRVTTASGPFDSTTTETYDRQGRLIQVDQHPDAATTVTAQYTYDVANHLAHVTMTGPEGTQNRYFTYDNRGFLTSEQHPEKGAGGNGTTSYTGYDARGHVGAKKDGATNKFALTMHYDAAERLVDVQSYDPNDQLRILKQFEFDGTYPGKLIRATRHNYQDGSTPADIVVSERYTYAGREGAVSNKKTCVDFVNTADGQPCDDTTFPPGTKKRVFSADFAYDELGNILSTTYPACTGCGITPPQRTVTNTFSYGFLKSVSSSFNGAPAVPVGTLTYAPSGAVASVVHGDTAGTTDTITPDPSGMPRPQSISFDKWIDCAAPAITQQPASQSVSGSPSVTLSVTATSATSPQYQWYAGVAPGGTKISGATASAYTIANAQSGSYWVQVTNACGSVNSATATITTGDPNCTVPVITTQPANVTILSGQQASLGVTASGTNLTYQWYQGTAGDTSLPVSGGNGPLFTTPALTTTTSYWARVSGCSTGASVNSATATVTVDATCYPLQITSVPPLSIDAYTAGAQLQLGVSASGSQPHYQWYTVDGATETAIAGATAAVLSTSTIKTTHYRVHVTSGCDPAVNLTADTIVHVTRCTGITINAQPVDQRITSGDRALMLFDATAPPAMLSFTWYTGAWGDTTNQVAIGSQYHTPPLTVDTVYWCRVQQSPDSCAVDSRLTTVSICHPPHIGIQPQSQVVTPGIYADLEVTVSGDGLSYEWYQGLSGDTSHLAGTTTVFKPLVAQVVGSTPFWVRVTGECGVQDSATAYVTYCIPPTVSTQPAAETPLIYGQTTTLSAAAAEAGVTFTWYMTSDPIAGQLTLVGNGATYTLPVLDGGDYYFRARASNGTCTTDSNWAHVHVCVPPQVTMPADVLTTARDSVRLEIPAADGLTYTWYLGATSGDTTTQVQTGNVLVTSPQTTTSYWARVDNGTCHTDSPPVTVNVCRPLITAQSTNMEIVAGSAATLSVTAVGTEPFTYQWYQGPLGSTTNPVPNSNSPSVQVSPQATTTYWGTVASACSPSPTATSLITVTVCVPPAITAQSTPAMITAGDSATLSVTATGTPASGTALQYAWYVGASGDTSHPVTGNATAVLTVTPSTTSTYWVRVTGRCGSADSTTITVPVCIPPAITTQPADTVITQGTTATLSVATSATGVTYHWYEGTAPDASKPVGTNAATFTTPVLNATTAYWVSLAAGGCSRASATATVTVCIRPAITAQPVGQSNVVAGSHAALSVTASPSNAGDTLVYDWYYGTSGNTSQPYALNSTATLSPIVNTTTSFWVRVTGGACSVDSATATFDVCIPAITTQPADASIVQGNSTILSVAANGTTPFTYQWYNGAAGTTTSPIAGATGNSVTVSPTSTSTYWVQIKSPCSTATNGVNSRTVTVTVCVPPSAPVPAAINITQGQTATMAVSPSGTGPFTYQWYTGAAGTTTSPITGATTNTCSVTPTQTTSYWVKVTGACGTANVAYTVNVCVPPAITTQPASTTIVDGATATLSVATSATSVTYQWYQGTAPDTSHPVGTNASTYTTAALTATTSYWVRLTGSCSRDSATAIVSVCTRPTITAQPVGQSNMTSGSHAALSVTATPANAGDTLVYDWYYGTSGNTTQPYALNSNPTASPIVTSTTSFWVRVTGGACSIDSATAKFDVCIPAITTQPADASIVQGNSTILSVAANGTTPFTYQWYNGAAGTTTSPIAAATSNTLNVSPTSTSTYWVQIKSPCSTATNGVNSRTVTVTVCIPPSAPAPAAINITQGQTATMAVSPSGTGPFTYQWYTGAAGTTTSPITGATTNTCSVTPTQTTSYWVKVTGACGTSNVAYTVNVCVPPAITTQPASTTIVDGATATLSVATSATSVTYQWYQGTAPDTSHPVGTNASTYTTAALTATTSYWVRLTGSCSRDSATAIVSVCTRPTITAQPVGQSNMTSGAHASLSVTATPANAGDTLVYDWYYGTSGNTTQAYALNSTATLSPIVTTTTSFWVRVTGGGCSRDSSTATFDVCIPAITTQPADASIVQGNSTTLSVAANGTTPFTYQWYNGASGTTTSPITGATSASLLVSPTTTSTYWVQIKSPCSTATNGVASRTVTVTVCVPASITTSPAATTNINSGQTAVLSVTAAGTAPTYQWYTGTSGTTTSPIAAATSSSLSVTPASTTSYWVKVTGQCGTAVNSTTATVDVCTVPAITTQPADTIIQSGSSATFSVVASGTTLTYQWYEGQAGDVTKPVTGGTAATLTTRTLTADTYFWVRITSKSRCSTDSTAALAQICVPPSAAVTPQSAGIAAGQSVTLSVPTGAASYAWYRGTSGDTSSGVIGSSYYYTAGPSATTNYWVRVGNGYCTADSITVPVQVCVPTITAQPVSTTIAQTTSTQLQVTASSATGYQWYIGASGTTTSPISGATLNTYTASPSSTTTYWVRVSGSCGTVNSQAATVTVTPCTRPTITAQPQSVTIQSGASATLSVTAGGTNLTYQWYKSDPAGGAFVAITGATTATITNKPASSSATYYVTISNACGNVTSSQATVTTAACAPPAITHQPVDTTYTPGTSVTFSVTATGTNLHYQWYKSDPDGAAWAAVTGGTSATLTIVPANTRASYYVHITGDCAPAVDSVHVLASPPCQNIVINSGPQSTTIAPGGTALMSVDASGSDIQYQWNESTDGGLHYSVISQSPAVWVSPGATSYYYCYLYNSCSGATTDVAAVTVSGGGGAAIVQPASSTPAGESAPRFRKASASAGGGASPLIIAQPLSGAVPPGGNATLSVAADSGTVQWFAATDDTPYARIDGASDAIVAVKPLRQTYYFARVTNDWGSTDSAVATIRVAPARPAPPVIRWLSPDVAFTAGTTVTLEVRASGTDVHYQWFRSTGSQFVPIGDDAPRLTDAPAGSETSYVVRVSNEAGFVDSSPVVVRAAGCPAVTVTTQPAGAAIHSGQSARLEVAASSDHELAYQWFSNDGTYNSWVAVPGAASSTITVAPETTTLYYCDVTSSCGTTVHTSTAVVEVNPQ